MMCWNSHCESKSRKIISPAGFFHSLESTRSNLEGSEFLLFSIEEKVLAHFLVPSSPSLSWVRHNFFALVTAVVTSGWIKLLSVISRSLSLLLANDPCQIENASERLKSNRFRESTPWFVVEQLYLSILRKFPEILQTQQKHKKTNSMRKKFLFTVRRHRKWNTEKKLFSVASTILISGFQKRFFLVVFVRLFIFISLCSLNWKTTSSSTWLSHEIYDIFIKAKRNRKRFMHGERRSFL